MRQFHFACGLLSRFVMQDSDGRKAGTVQGWEARGKEKRH